MQSMDMKYKNYIYKTINTFSPLYWQLNIFSLQCQLDGNIYFQLLRMALSAIISCIITIFSLYYKMVNIYHLLLSSIKYTDAVQAIYDYLQYIFDLYCVFKYGSDIFFEYINQYAYIDCLLDMDYYRYIRRRLIKVMVILYCMWFCGSVFDFVIWDIGFGFTTTSAFVMGYVYTLIKILSNLDLTAHVMQIEARLRVIGDTIQNCYPSFENICPKFEDTVAKNNWFYNDCCTSNKTTDVRRNPCLCSNDVKWLSRCYVLLTEQVTFINNMFGKRILLNSLSFLLDLVRYINLSVRILIGTQYSGSSIQPVIPTVFKAVNCAIVIFSLVSHCERTYRQRDRIIKLIDHLTLFKKLDDQLLSSFMDMRNLVVSRSITFHTDFNTLNYSWLVSIASVVVTYSIILLQNFN